MMRLPAMCRKLPLLVLIALAAPAMNLLALPNRVVRGDEQERAARLEFFEAKIRPVLVQHCDSCHSAKAETIQGGLRVDSKQGLATGGDSGAALSPGKPEESLLLAALRYEGPEMPPKGKLSDSVIADFERWIRDGAVDPRDNPAGVTAQRQIDFQEAAKFWAFQPPQMPAIPSVSDARAARNAIDHFVLGQLDSAGLSPNPRAEPRTLIRRAYFDLVGLPPTPEEVEQFVRDSEQNPDAAWQGLIERLLRSPHYGERWARHWLDVARYAEDQAHTFKARQYPRGYFYRDWVVQALNDDLPYDKFVMHQIAGDLLDEPDQHKRLAALGLFALGPVYYAENVEKAKANADEWDDRVDTLMRGVLGLTASCARCHDHKFDPITMRDYYGLVGIFASSQYQERAIVSDEVLERRQAADGLANQKQVAIDRFLIEQSRELRPKMVDQIPRYVVAAWKVVQRQSAGDAKNDKKNQNKNAKKTDKKLLEQIAKQQQLSATLLGKWVEYLTTADKVSEDERTWLRGWSEMLASQDGTGDLSGDEQALAQARAVGDELRDAVLAQVDRRERLLRHFGENVAFVKPEDRVRVEPGTIPLGNLFDDSASVSLDAALATDRFRAAASENSLGVDRVVQGWGDRTQIAPEIHFDFQRLGSDSNQHGQVTNDAWFDSGGIRTEGKGGGPQGRQEQGIGMHANALITFDLDEIRRAGLLPADQRFVFHVDRAGLNDDVFGSGTPSAHLAVIVSRPHRSKSVTDAILAAYVNGQQQEIATDDYTYYFPGSIPPPLKADGRFVALEIPIPSEARFLTLVATGAGDPDDNPINSDHTVFSGARLQLDPPPRPSTDTRAAAESQLDPVEEQQDRRHALLLSRMFYDEGLLALPPQEVESHLAQDEMQQLTGFREELGQLKKAAEAIAVPMAHSLMDGKGVDLAVYLQGNPEKKGDPAPRGMPAIFTDGQKQPFEPQGSGRLELARAIASPNNPLTARVIVNRVWAGHFGTGLVKTLSNFGQLGERPTHPELLDYLAVRFVEQGWSLKWLHQEIMSSATYCQTSAFDAGKYDVDPENRLLWRMNRRRLQIEPWRDGMLASTGELDRAIGGPSSDLGNANNHRRTLYGFVSRHRLNELLRLFDFPDPNITAANRSVTTVPLQQLFVLNSDFMVQRARALDKRLTELAGADNTQRVRTAYLLLFSRPATDDELQLALEFLEPSEGQEAEEGLSRWQQYALALLGANEFLYLD